MTFLLYGAYGYTGTLIAELAVARGLSPILAGRDANKLQQLGNRLGLSWRAVGLDDEAGLIGALEPCQAVLHCAGPFGVTSKPMVRACLQARKHYLDITGELKVIEAVIKQDARAKEAGVVLVPGVGFDVVPSDCQARHAKDLLPSATSIELFIIARGGASHGTLRTTIEGLHLEGAVRRNGVIVSEPIGARRRTFLVGAREIEGASVPWGDVASAYHSTGAGNITVYFPATGALRWFTGSRALRALMKLGVTRALLPRLLPAGGPSPAQRERGSSIVIAVARDDATSRERATLLRAPEGYTLTADAALICMDRVLSGRVAPGAHTPSQAFGADLVLECAGTQREDDPPLLPRTHDRS
jgi:saccharopine dehydrogenase (NAD+, L-lysine-forming)